MKLSFQILSANLFEQYKSSFDKAASQIFKKLHDSELSIKIFSFYTSVSAVFSSKIEGESIELDSFIKHKRFGVKYQPDYTRKIDDLYDAYLFAQKNKLTANTLAEAHAYLTKHILKQSFQGKFRKSKMFIVTGDGKIEYVAAAPEKVIVEMNCFYSDLSVLLAAKLNFKEVLFYASMLHLVFIKIHPFADGNGRAARLLEKWFIAQKLGDKAWFIQSEKYYYEKHQTYNNNIRLLGMEYNELNYSAALPFLKMLPEAINF